MAKATRKAISKGLKKAQEGYIPANDAIDFLMTIPEIKEAFTRADIELALDDRGWLVPGRQWTASDLDAQTRTTLVAKARLYWHRDPLAKQAVRLWTDYCLGTGITYKVIEDTDDTADGDPEESETDAALQERTSDDIQCQLDKFTKCVSNRAIMCSEGQRKSSKKLLVDGEVFFALFKDEDTYIIRHIDCMQITDLICDPDDDEHVLGYRRLAANDKVLYYADWKCTDEDLAMLATCKDPTTHATIGRVEEDVKVYMLAFDTLQKRGNGLLHCVVDWSKEHRKFMEARVALTAALAKFAFKNKVKGGQAIVNQIRNQMSSTYAVAGMNTVERNPPPAPGSTHIENDGMNLEQMKVSSGAGDARSDGDQLKLMVSSGTGIMLHYFGDPSTGNLATATAMELPMLKQFQSYQQLWMDAYRDIFSIVLEEDLDAEPLPIDIDLPPILADDLQKIGSFITQAAGVFPEMKVPEVLQMMLVSLGVNNIDDVMEKIAKQKEQLDADAAQNTKAALQNAKLAAQSKPVAASPGGGNLPGQTPGSPSPGGEHAEALRITALTAALTKLAEKLG